MILIEAAGLGGPMLPLVLVPGLLAAGIGSLVSIGMGSLTGLSTSAYALGPLSVPAFARPDVAEFGWTIALAAAIAVVAAIDRSRRTGDPARRDVATAVAVAGVGLIVAGLAIAFSRPAARTSSRSCSRVRARFPGWSPARGRGRCRRSRC